MNAIMVPEWRAKAGAGMSLSAAKKSYDGNSYGGDKALGVELSRSMAKILRPQAAYRWLLPQLASITPQYIEMTLRGALAGNHVQAWELFDLMEDTWPRLSKNANQLKDEVEQELRGWRARPYQEDDESPTDQAKERARLANAAIFGMRPRAAEDENAFGGTVRDLMDAWLKGQVVLETDWEMRRAGSLGEIWAPRATFWVHPTCVAWSMDGSLGLRLELAQGSATLTPGVFTSTSYQPMPNSVTQFPEHKFLIGIRKAKSGTALGGARLRPLCWWWCAANFSADWLLNLAQLWSLPFRWANYDPNAPQSVIDSICAMLENMGNNAWAAFPAGTTMELEYPGSNTGGNGPADNIIDRADKNCDLLVLGQTLTTDVSREAGSRSQGEVHERVEAKIMRAACAYVAEIFNTQLVPSILILNYGDGADEERPEFRAEDEDEATVAFKREVYKNWSQHPVVSSVMANQTDLKQVTRDVGLPINEDYTDPYVPVKDAQGNLVTGDLIEDSEGDVIGAETEEQKPEPEPQGVNNPQKNAGSAETGDEENLKNPKPKPETPLSARRAVPGAPTDKFEEAAHAAIVKAIATDLAPVRDRLGRILEIKDPVVMEARLRVFLEDIEQLRRDVTADPALAQELQKVIASGMANGMAASKAKPAVRKGGGRK